MESKEFQWLGPPGCGKTTAVAGTFDDGADPYARNIRRAVEKHGAEKVIASSFTNAAAHELVSRDLPLPRSNVGTLHSMGYHTLGSPPLIETKKGLEEWNTYCSQQDATRPYRLTMEGQDRDEPSWNQKDGETQGDRAFALLSGYRARLTPRALWNPSVQAFEKHWTGFKRETGYIDFSDMIDLPLQEGGPMLSRPAVGFFDEFQDFNQMQAALVRLWGSFMDSYVLAGDPDQTIMAFQGADPRCFLDHPVPEGWRVTLKQSHRVPRAIHAWAEAWVQRIQDRIDREYEPRAAEGALLRSGSTWRDVASAVRLALEALEEQNDQGEPKTVMFLTTCGYMLGPLKAYLRERGIPFHNPYRKDDRQGWNPLRIAGEGRESIRITAVERILAYLRPDAATFGDHARFWNGDDVRCWAEFLQADGVIRKGMKARLKDLSPAEVTVDDLMAVFEEEAVFSLVDVNLSWFRQHLMPSKREGLAYPIRVAEARGGHALREQPRVIVGTTHSVKGGEADVVFLFPDLSPAGAEEWQSGGAHRDAIRRLFYVGATRARETLVLCSPAAAAQAVPWR